jgi:hypothetical protein
MRPTAYETLIKRRKTKSLIEAKRASFGLKVRSYEYGSNFSALN